MASEDPVGPATDTARALVGFDAQPRRVSNARPNEITSWAWRAERGSRLDRRTFEECVIESESTDRAVEQLTQPEFCGWFGGVLRDDDGGATIRCGGYSTHRARHVTAVTPGGDPAAEFE